MFRSFHPDDQISILTGEVTKVRENGATSGIGVLATYGYDDLGNRTSAAYGNGTAQAFGYDPVSRLSSLTVDLAGTASDLTKTFAYNPASQIVTETRSNDAYAQVLANSTQTTVTNGLNQLATVNGTAAAYDARGNMTTDPATAKTYSYYGSNNQLWNVPSPFTTLGYDALDRLASFNTGAPVTNYVSDGNTPIAEYDGSNVLQKRYAFDGSGQPLVQYDASGNRTWMVGDERGSVIALASDSGAMTSIDTYDEYGIPGATNTGTFQYAGMLWLSRAGLYAPTYRAYGAHLGRFGQTDPVGYRSGPNIYNYVLGDPVNLVDPLGTCQYPGTGTVTGSGGSVTVSCPPWDFGAGPGGDISGVTLNAIDPRPKRLSRQGDEDQQQNQCPTGTLAGIRSRAIETAKWSGVASGVLGIAGAVPTPATPFLEGTALAFQIGSFLSTTVVVSTDIIFVAQGGSSQVLKNDLAGAAFGAIPLGSLGASANRLTSSGRSINQSLSGRISQRLGNAAQNTNAAFTWPDKCK